MIVDGYRIGDFLRKDHRLGCSAGKAPQERCKSPFCGHAAVAAPPSWVNPGSVQPARAVGRGAGGQRDP